MTLRDLLLVLGGVPMLGVVALRLAAEMGLVAEAPPPEALPVSLAAFGVVFLVYLALTLRAIARATRAILAREAEATVNPDPPAQRRAAVTDFAIHLDRTAEAELPDPDAGPPSDPEAALPVPTGRPGLFVEVSELLTRIPSTRRR